MCSEMKLPSLFNPSNDMALAANVRQYFPPHRIRQMESDLASLARFWDEGPWGWSLATKQCYLRMGIPQAELPTDDWLAQVRRLSSREFAVGYYSDYCNSEPYRSRSDSVLPCQSRFCRSEEEALTAIAEWPAAMLKSPWSSSGRGNFIVRTGEDSQRQRIRHTIEQQGGIVVEPYYEEKAVDFAMEFWIRDAGGAAVMVDFLGYSVFFADEMGHYGGNCIESQEQLKRRIGVPQELLDALVAYHRHMLARLSYRGPVGIDMMRMADGRVHPCVEINFRMTMGLLALLLYRQGIRDDQLLTPECTHGFVCSIRHGCIAIHYRT